MFFFILMLFLVFLDKMFLIICKFLKDIGVNEKLIILLVGFWKFVFFKFVKEKVLVIDGLLLFLFGLFLILIFNCKVFVLLLYLVVIILLMYFFFKLLLYVKNVFLVLGLNGVVLVLKYLLLVFNNVL